jgi:hypothetical protein
MALKSNDSCLQKAAEDEPIFVLRAQDTLAPELVREWADRAEDAGTPSEKVEEARDLARQMEDWQAANTSKVPD